MLPQPRIYRLYSMVIVWKRFARQLRCPVSGDPLELHVFDEVEVSVEETHWRLAEELGVAGPDFGTYVEAGVLVNHTAGLWYPIYHGLPVFLLFPNNAHYEFETRYRDQLADLGVSYGLPAESPEPGEEFVMQSFSKEWLEYDYDGVIWEMDYQDHEKRFLSELGDLQTSAVGPFMEVGCGLGLTTEMAHRNLRMDAIGVDLSFAAMRAAGHFKHNPFLHFVQASVFHLPFADKSIGTLYSHGVLHHTYSTEFAFRRASAVVRPGGLCYIWVYGSGSQFSTPLRRILWGTEALLRPVLSRAPTSASTLVLSPVALAYIAFNRYRRLKTPTIQPLNFMRAMHAARDRYTPQFAHRQDHATVTRWFEEAGFESVQVSDWRLMPAANHEDYGRNTGVRGLRVAER